MKPKIEQNKEYPTREGGKAVVYRDDGRSPYPLIGAVNTGNGWRSMHWRKNGAVINNNEAHPLNIVVPRTVMLPVTVPEWAKSVKVNGYGQPSFSCDPEDSVWISIEDWITSLEGR